MPVSFRRIAAAVAAIAITAGIGLSLGVRPGGAAAVPGGTDQAIDPAWDFCAAQIARVEREEGIPRHLLAVIAVVESGRRHPGTGEISAWPWTVMAEGKGKYLPTRHAAIAEVEALQARGVRNIDVGCMQINLMHHPKAFSGLEEAFDPAANVAYAAAFLKQLREEKGSWTKAVGHYHSATPARSVAYRAKVFTAWREARRRALKEAGSTELAGAPSPISVRVPPPPPAAAPAEPEAPTVLAALAFGRVGPVEPDPGS